MSDIKWKASTRASNPVTVLSTGLDALANNSGALSSTIDNDTDLDLYMDLELAVDFVSAPTADSVVECWVARTVDGGTTFEDAAGGVTPILPRNGFVGNWVLRATTDAQRMIIPGVVAPPGDFKILVVNKSGQAFPAVGSTVRAFFYREQVTG